MTNATPFNQLSEAEQQERLNKYEQERAARGTKQALVRLVKPATIKDIANGNQLAVFRFAEYNKETKEPKFFTATAFIKAGKDSLKSWYQNLTKGQLLSLEYKEEGNYTNVYNLIDRSYADKRKSKKNSGVQGGMQKEAELEV